MAALQTVGAFLVICLVVTPGATAWLLTDRFPRLLMIAVAIGSITSFLGAWASYYGRRHRRHYRGRPDAAVPAGVRLCAEARTACQPSSGAGGTPMMTLLLEPFQFAFMNNALLISLGGRALRAAVGFSGAERLGVDGRRHEPRGVSRRRAGSDDGPAAGAGRVRGRSVLRGRHRIPEG